MVVQSGRDFARNGAIPTADEDRGDRTDIRLESSGEAPLAIMEREGLKQISDSGELERILAEVIAKNPKQVEQYKGGKSTVLNFLVGQVMRATRGQANVALVTDLLKQKLG